MVTDMAGLNFVAAAPRCLQRLEMRQGIVPTSVGKRHIVIVKPPVSAQFEEYLQYELERLRKYNYSHQWLQKLLENVGKNSPKTQCWLFREACAATMRHYQGDEIVARENGKETKDQPKVEWRFVNIQLTDDEREAARMLYSEQVDLWDTVVVCLKDGYKVTLSFDAETDSYCAALSGTRCGKPNQNLTLTAWGDDEMSALAYVIYKHAVKLEFVWEREGMKAKRLG